MKEKESMTRTGKKIVCICMILSLILTCILCVTPVTAKAAEEETPETNVREATPKAATAAEGPGKNLNNLSKYNTDK